MDTPQTLEKVAAASGVDLETLDLAMRECAEREPQGLERMLLDADVPREAWLRVGLLVHELLKTKEHVRELETGHGV